MPLVEQHVDVYRRQVRRILSSQEFAGSRQMREFLQYVSEAAFQGRTHLEQVEIAEKVLQRGKDFNPLDDASVRKLATTVRQRLEHYYETEGSQDPVRVTLPVRSYIPYFELRDQAAAEAAPPPAAAPPVSRRRWLLGLGAVGLAGAGAAAAWRKLGTSEVEYHPVFVIRTAHGDIMHERNDVPPDAIRLGPGLEPLDEVTARLTFTPERATQQAGILIYRDADQYVKFGRQFLARPQLEFGAEVNGRYLKPPQTFAYDPDAQTGEPVWLSIRRLGEEYLAFVSSDGLRWRPFGNRLQLSEPLGTGKAGIFAHNGRSDAPSAEARFDHVSVGVSFHNRPQGAADLASIPGWRALLSGGGVTARFDSEALVLELEEEGNTGGIDFVRTAPKGDWTYLARLDFLSVHGSTAGLIARGSKGRFRFIRWDLDGGSITAEHLGNTQVNRRDFEGAPPLVLRMDCRNGVISYSFSRDDRTYHHLPLAKLTDRELDIGLHVSKSSWLMGEPLAPARFCYFRRQIDRLENHR
jgi:hypothetical protein